MKRNKVQPQKESSTSIPTDIDRSASDFEMLEPIDSFTVEMFGASVPSRSMTLQAKSDPVRRAVTNKLLSSPSNIRNERRGEKSRSPQPPPQSTTTDASPYVTLIAHNRLNLNKLRCSITSFSKPFPSPKKNVAAHQVEPITLAKHPQLHFQPLHEVGFARPRPKSKIAVAHKTTIHNSNPPTSPIEETSVVLPPIAVENQGKDKMAMSTTSDLYLEVKERIAKHSTTKQRDRLLKRGSSKMTAPADESSIIYVSSSPSSRASSPIPVVKNAITLTSKQQQKTTKQPPGKRKRGKKEKPQPMTPTEYAWSLNEKLAAAASIAVDTSTSNLKLKKRTPIKFLEGKYIFYTGGDMKHASEMTRGRMALVGLSSSLASRFTCFIFRLSNMEGIFCQCMTPKLLRTLSQMPWCDRH